MLQFKGSWEGPLPGVAEGNVNHKLPSIYDSTDSKGDGQMANHRKVFFNFPNASSLKSVDLPQMKRLKAAGEQDQQPLSRTLKAFWSPGLKIPTQS